MTLQERLLGEIRAVDDGLELDIGLNWYRSLPLSCIETLELTLDGEDVPREEITFNDRSLDELCDRWDEYWFVLDSATLRVRRPLPERLSVRLGVRIPYLGRPVVYTSERTLDLAGADG